MVPEKSKTKLRRVHLNGSRAHYTVMFRSQSSKLAMQSLEVLSLEQ